MITARRSPICFAKQAIDATTSASGTSVGLKCACRGNAAEELSARPRLRSFLRHGRRRQLLRPERFTLNGNRSGRVRITTSRMPSAIMPFVFSKTHQSHRDAPFFLHLATRRLTSRCTRSPRISPSIAAGIAMAGTPCGSIASPGSESSASSTAWKLSPRDPVAVAWADRARRQKDEWDLRMAVYAAMIDCMDQGIGRVLDTVRKIGAEQDTLVIFLSDNGASAEFLDTWPNPAAATSRAASPAREIASLPRSRLGERRQHALSRAQDVGT